MNLDNGNQGLHTPRRRMEPLDSPQYILLDNGELAVKVTENPAEPDNPPRRLVPMKRMPQQDERVMQSIEVPGRNLQNRRSQENWLDHVTASSERTDKDHLSASRRPITPDPRIFDLSVNSPVVKRHKAIDSYMAATEGRNLPPSSVQPQGRHLVPESKVRLRPDLRPEPVEVVYARKSPDRRDASDYHFSLGRPEQVYQRRTLPADDGRVLISDHQTLISGHGHQGDDQNMHSATEHSSFSQSQFRPLSAIDGGVSYRSSHVPMHYEQTSPKYGSPYISRSRDILPRHVQRRDENDVRIVRSESAMMSQMDSLHLKPGQLNEAGPSDRYFAGSATRAPRPLQDYRLRSSVGLQAQAVPLAGEPQSPWESRSTRAEPVNDDQWNRSRIFRKEDLSVDVPLPQYDARPNSTSNQSRFVMQRQYEVEGNQPHGSYRGQGDGSRPIMAQLNQPYVNNTWEQLISW